MSLIRKLLLIVCVTVSLGSFAAGIAAWVKGDPAHVWAAYYAFSTTSAAAALGR